MCQQIATIQAAGARAGTVLKSTVVNEALNAMHQAAQILPIDAQALQAAQQRLSAAAVLLAKEQGEQERFKIDLQWAFGMMPSIAPSNDTIVEIVTCVAKACYGPLKDFVTVARELDRRGLESAADDVMRLACQTQNAATGQSVADLFKAMVDQAHEEA